VQTLTYGLKKPDTNDKGPVVFPALEANIVQIDAHNHDGATSKKLTTSAIDAVAQTILAANWVSLGGGNYHQQVTMLPGYDYDLTVISFRTTAGEYVHPGVKKVSSSVLDVYSNDASDLILMYGV
jgi:hypothetical protein